MYRGALNAAPVVGRSRLPASVEQKLKEKFSAGSEVATDMELQPDDSLEGINASISHYKTVYNQLVQDEKDLASLIKESRELTEMCRQRSVKLAETLENNQCYYREQMATATETVSSLNQEMISIMEEICKVETAINQEEAECNNLKQQRDVFATAPERQVVFRGKTENAARAQVFGMKSRIVYPMDGGTALVTFQDEAAAKNILSMKRHQVSLGDECWITVEAHPVHLTLPSLVEIDTNVCPRRILISNLPETDEETRLQLQVHFHKRKNGGGEVEACDLLQDSGTVVLTFVETNIAKGLTDAEHHEVQLKNKKHRVRVTPFINGEITSLKTKMSVCRRSVLLTGIPPVMEQESLQDMLEIHFQKSRKGGGEILAFLYNPEGEQTSALFESISPDNKE